MWGGRKTSLWLDKSRMVSEDKKGIVLWLTLSNAHKFTERSELRLFLGHNDSEDWKYQGVFRLKCKTKIHKYVRGLTYLKCRLEKVNEK